jgi:glutamyl/glutaminyl-tRNA synthetase
MIESVKGRAGKLSELPALLDFYFQLPDYPAELLRWQGITLEATADNLRAGRVLVEAIAETDFTKQRLEDNLLEQIPQEKRGDILWPLRVALSGKTASPSPFEIMAVLGKQESLRRIDLALAKIQSKAQ